MTGAYTQMSEAGPQLKLLKGGVHDSRFGTVDLFAAGDSQSPCVFSVNSCCRSDREFETAVAHNQSRLALDCPSLLQMIGLQTAVETLTLIAYFEYPSCTLRDRFPQLQSSEEELFRLVSDIAAATAYLERLGAAHGELTPDMIGFSEARGTYVLLDRFNSPLTPELALREAIESNKRLYLSPRAFESPSSFNCYKNDVFSLGLIALETVVGQAPVQSLFDVKMRLFDYKRLALLVESLKSRNWASSHLQRCLAEHVLAVSEWNRPLPTELTELLAQKPQNLQIDSKDDWGPPDDAIINNFDVPEESLEAQEVDFLQHDKDSQSASLRGEDKARVDGRSLSDVDFAVNRPLRTVSECAPDNRSSGLQGALQVQSRTEVVSATSPLAKGPPKRGLFLRDVGSHSNFKLKYLPTVSLMGDEALTPQTPENRFFPTSDPELAQTADDAAEIACSLEFATPERPTADHNQESSKPVRPEFLLSHHLSFAERTDALTSSAVQEAERESLAQDLLAALTDDRAEPVSRPKVLALTQVYFITDVHRNLSVKVFCEAGKEPTAAPKPPKTASVTFVDADLNYARVVANLSLNGAKIN